MTKHNVTDLIKFPVRADEYSTYIWDADENMIAQVRGWGRLSYQKDGAEKQDFILKFIADAINNAQSFDELKAENERLRAANEWKIIARDGLPGDSGGYLVTDELGKVFQLYYDLCEGEWNKDYLMGYQLTSWSKYGKTKIIAWRNLPEAAEVE